jgi:hypothetical protein
MSRVNRFCFFAVPLMALGLMSLGHTAPTPSAAYSRTVKVNGHDVLIKSRLKSLMVTSFFFNYNHQYGIPNLVSTMQRIGTKEGFSVVEAKTKDDVTAASLAKVQVLFGNYISSWASKPDFGAPGRAAVQSFVEGGGGVFIMHAAGDSRLGNPTPWPWFFSTAHPTVYVGEGTKSGTAPVFIAKTAKAHPVMDGINFAGHDTVTFNKGEWHQFSKSISAEVPSVEILLRMDYTKNTDAEASFAGYKIDPAGYPCSWTFPVKAGRIGYFMEGHALETMNDFNRGGDAGNPMWDKFFTQFMYYMAGYDTVTTAVKGPRTDKEFAVNRDGITFHPQDEVGVMISEAGNHQVTLFDMSGRKMKEYKGATFPIDYNFSDAMQGAKSGVYVVRAALGRNIKSKRFIVR